MPANPSRVPKPGEWVKIRLPDGRSVLVTTRFDRDRGRIVIVKPISEREQRHGHTAA